MRPPSKRDNVISFRSELVKPLLVGAHYSLSPGKRLHELQQRLRNITSFINVRIGLWEILLIEINQFLHQPNLKVFIACFCYLSNVSFDISLFLMMEFCPP